MEGPALKRGTPDHPKMHRLARALGVPRAQAAGHLEFLWHWTAKFAPRGDVGRFQDVDIEQGADWKGPAGALVSALEAEGWLDPHPEVRLIVHDWHEHADDAVKKLLARKGLSFYVSCPDNGGQRRTPADNGSLPEPLPLPLPLTTPPPPSQPPEAPADPPAHGGREKAREAVLEHWRAQARRYGVPGPERADGRKVWASLVRGRSVREICGSVDEFVRDSLIHAGRLDPSAPWPPEAELPDRGPPASADACNDGRRCATDGETSE